MKLLLIDLAKQMSSRQENLVALVNYIVDLKYIEFTVVCSKGSKLAECLDNAGISHIELFDSKIAILYSILKLSKLIRSFKPDIVHCFGGSAASIIGMCKSLSKCTAGIVYTLPSHPLEEIESEVPEKLLNRVSPFQSLKKMICPSIYAMALLSKRGIPIEYMESIPLTLTNNICKRVKYRVDGRFIFLCHLEELSASTVTTLVRALVLISIRQDIPQWEFRVIGNFKNVEPLLTMAEEAGVEKNLAILGRQNIGEQISISDVAICHNSSSYDRNFFTLQAMAAGVPIIASNVPTTLEIIGDKNNAILYEPTDYKFLTESMLRIMLDNQLYRKLSKAGEAEFIKHSTAFASQKIVFLYRKIVSDADA